MKDKALILTLALGVIAFAGFMMLFTTSVHAEWVIGGAGQNGYYRAETSNPVYNQRYNDLLQRERAQEQQAAELQNFDPERFVGRSVPMNPMIPNPIPNPLANLPGYR